MSSYNVRPWIYDKENLTNGAHRIMSSSLCVLFGLDYNIYLPLTRLFFFWFCFHVRLNKKLEKKFFSGPVTD